MQLTALKQVGDPDEYIIADELHQVSATRTSSSYGGSAAVYNWDHLYYNSYHFFETHPGSNKTWLLGW